MDTSIIVCKGVRIALMPTAYMYLYVKHALLVCAIPFKNKQKHFLLRRFPYDDDAVHAYFEFVLSKSHNTPGCMQDASTLLLSRSIPARSVTPGFRQAAHSQTNPSRLEASSFEPGTIDV